MKFSLRTLFLMILACATIIYATQHLGIVFITGPIRTTPPKQRLIVQLYWDGILIFGNNQ